VRVVLPVKAYVPRPQLRGGRAPVPAPDGGPRQRQVVGRRRLPVRRQDEPQRTPSAPPAEARQLVQSPHVRPHAGTVVERVVQRAERGAATAPPPPRAGVIRTEFLSPAHVHAPPRPAASAAKPPVAPAAIRTLRREI